MSVSLTREEVAKHNTEEDIWTIIDHKVYDLSDFIDAHPGGSVVLAQIAGTDSTEAFYNLHRHEVLQKYSSLCLGEVEGEKSEIADPQPGDLSEVPYAEPLWLKPESASPYYNDSHRRLQKAMRKFTDEHVTPEAREKEDDGTFISQELIDKMAETNVLAMRLGPGKHLHGKNILGGVVDGKEFDYFHDMIVGQELARPAARGFQDGNMAGMAISLTAVQQWLWDEELKQKVTDEVLSGKKKMCLAVTEAFAGSDVAGIRTTAELTEDGQHFLVSGTKKWITNGMFSDYFVVACKTAKGFSVLLVPRSEAVETKLIKTSYSTAAGTTYIQFDKAKVPVKNLLGREGQGFEVVMSNFNHERWMMCGGVIRWMRLVVEECLKWSHQRIVFGKPLISQPVIRQKIARMISLAESNQAWLEQITHQMNNMTYAQQSKLLSGPIALLKSHATRCAHDVADDATNIFGGRGLTRGGMGRVVEMFHRGYKFDAILGGTEEILADLGVRQAMKQMPKARL
ncbi:hypothetical protein WHR41_00161 [Cladosporium halotolerans]|uniref:Cytochrome b5 heme-binding domain-containing protein n=1 Tax=Cladosporium halotolerans TaxID=1052096 RepID=A0AB34L8T1_9PEZI